MEILENRTLYRCEYCGKLSLSKGGLAIHEKKMSEEPRQSKSLHKLQMVREKDVRHRLRGNDRFCLYERWLEDVFAKDTLSQEERKTKDSCEVR